MINIFAKTLSQKLTGALAVVALSLHPSHHPGRGINFKPLRSRCDEDARDGDVACTIVAVNFDPNFGYT